MMKSSMFLVALVALMGAACAATTYTSVAAAVQALPELSTLASNLKGTTLSTQFEDPAYVGTVFLPTNNALASLSDQVGGDFQTLMADNPDQANEIFSYSVVPNQALLPSALKDGTKLTTKSGDTLTVTNKSGVIYVNNIAVGTSVIAGKAIVYELQGVLLPQDIADLLGQTTSSPDSSSEVDPFAEYTTTTTDANTATTGTTATTTATTTDVSGSDVAAVGASPSSSTPGSSSLVSTTSKTTNSAIGATFGTAALALPALLALLI